MKIKDIVLVLLVSIVIFVSMEIFSGTKDKPINKKPVMTKQDYEKGYIIVKRKIGVGVVRYDKINGNALAYSLGAMPAGHEYLLNDITTTTVEVVK